MRTLPVDAALDEGRAGLESGLVVGIVAPGWRIEHITVSGHAVLGLPVTDLVGASLLGHVHPGDIGGLRSAVDRALADRANVALELRMGRFGTWRAVRMVITPIVNDAGRGFGIAITDVGTSSTAARTTRLEQHLRRIAREVEAAGLSIGTDLPALPIGEDLSPRQHEVLRRLLEGERVPGIARTLHLSASTVRNHLAAIFAKLGVHSQAELIELLKAKPALRHDHRHINRRAGT